MIEKMPPETAAEVGETRGSGIILFGKEIPLGKGRTGPRRKHKAPRLSQTEPEISLPEDNETLPTEEDLLVEAPAKLTGLGKGRKREEPAPEEVRLRQTIDFFDRVSPGVIRYYTDYYILGNTYRCAWVLREFSPSTQDMALLRGLADKTGVSLRIYHSMVSAAEQKQILDRALRKSNVEKNSGDFQKVIEGVADQEDLISMRRDQRGSRDGLLYCTVYIELRAKSLEALRALQNDVDIELLHSKMTVDKLLLRQREGCLSVMPFGYNALERQYARVLPLSSVANLYPFTYCGKTDPQGFYIGKARYGTNLLVDLDLRDTEHTNGSVLVLGNSGEGKSYLMKILLTILREAGKSILILDPEGEYQELCGNMGGCCLDLMTGEYIINPLEPRQWTDFTASDRESQSDGDPEDQEPAVFRKDNILDQHISWLKDWFAAYQAEFSSDHLSALEILLLRLYERFGITKGTDLSGFKPTDYPILEDLFQLCEWTLRHYDDPDREPELFTKDCLRKITLGIRSICVGAESAYFNGPTNITDSCFLVFGVADLLNTNDALKNAMLFNILSYMSDRLLKQGNTALGADEAYLFLDYPIAVRYLRSFMKRVRKRDSHILIASTHVEDFLVPEIKEYTKPLFSTPTHRFLFYPGSIGEREYCDALRLDPAEYSLISSTQRGVCLYCSGRERYHLEIETQPYRAAMFGSAGGR